MSLLRVENLSTHFPTPDGVVRAVDRVSFSIEAGAAVGIVGESGSGKSVLSMTLMGLIGPPQAQVTADRIEWEGEDLSRATAKRRRELRGDRMAMIFQDPMTSLNPFLTIGDQIAEPLVIHRGLSPAAARTRAVELLTQVGIPDAPRNLDAFPHQFSGGMRQRAMVAMAMACRPALLIADEPTTALDVTIQAQIIDLMHDLRRRQANADDKKSASPATRPTAIVLITHDLGLAAGFCDWIMVMYAGRIVEQAPTEELFARPAHPYTRALLRSVPRLDETSRDPFYTIAGSPPDLTRLPEGCAFAPRCDAAIERCAAHRPELEPIAGHPGRRACFVELLTGDPKPTLAQEESPP